MRQDTTQADGSVVLASGSAGAGTAQPDTAVALPKIAPFGARLNVARRQLALGPVSGRIALGALMLGALVVVLFASARRSPLVPHSAFAFPGWEAGPLHGLIGGPIKSNSTINIGFSVVLVTMTVAYGAALLAVRTLSMRTIVIWVVVVHAILLLGPPLQLTDLFNYLGYARLGAVHHITPYTHTMGLEFHDPIFRFASWHHLRSPYGYLFTAITYPIAMLPIPVAYWVLKLLAVVLSLVFIWLVWKCAQLLGRDGRFAVMFVAANPIYLMYAVAGFHNDFFMLVPSTAAVALLLSHRDRPAGAALMVAVFVKFTAVLLLPFLLIAVHPAKRRLQVLLGALLAAIPLAAVSFALFGLTIPNLQDQSTLLTDFSVPNVLGDLLHIGGTPLLLRIANVGLVITVLYCLRRRGDWLAGAGWSTFALVASLAWLVPWYVIWVLPLAALGTSIYLRRAAIAFTTYLVLAFMPATAMFLSAHNVDLMGTAAGQASKALQVKLAG